ncbi:hypothetical protein Prudu_020145 [Prunus dulcis]|uniref:Universal stress protein family protein n=1 Tax=Prunus dulcis TaxID=3755 RepID=A0A4Y1RUM7_PRUDU|nr:hypothetical protein Prudu_020145 [Prunus dulcis]
MAFAHYPVTIPVETTKHAKTSILKPPSSSESLSLSLPPPLKPRNLSIFSGFRRLGHNGKYFHSPSAQAEPQEPQISTAADAITHFKHLLLPIVDGNPYLSEGTRQAIATAAALANKYGADITVVVIDEKEKESLPQHETQLSTIRWHLSEEYRMQLLTKFTTSKNRSSIFNTNVTCNPFKKLLIGGFKEYKLLERLGEGNKPTAIIGEVADDLNLDLVVISMEAIHSKHVDANLLAEFIPCPSLSHGRNRFIHFELQALSSVAHVFILVQIYHNLVQLLIENLFLPTLISI